MRWPSLSCLCGFATEPGLQDEMDTVSSKERLKKEQPLRFLLTGSGLPKPDNISLSAGILPNPLSSQKATLKSTIIKT